QTCRPPSTVRCLQTPLQRQIPGPSPRPPSTQTIPTIKRTHMLSRRHFLAGAGSLIGAGLVSKAGAAAIPEAQIVQHADTLPPPLPPNGRPFHPVVTLIGWSASWRMKNGWKEFHLIAKPVIRELAPGMKATLWGYNGSSPG